MRDMDNDLRTQVRDVRAEGKGFVNFYLSDRYFHGTLDRILAEGRRYGRSTFGGGKKALVEFVSANPTGPLSVAHARQAVVGDSLAAILESQGFAVSKEYYLNDEGNQITILGRSVELRLKQLNGENIDFPETCYQGDYIVDMARAIKEGDLPVTDFASYASEQILTVIRQELDDFRVSFDSWFSQKALAGRGEIERTFDVLKAGGHLFEQDGALWFRSTALGDDKDRVVVKSDGSYTYLAPDIAYHRDKYGRGFGLLVNLLGPDHHGYINRLKAAVQALGHDPKTLQVIIVQLATISRAGKLVEMSTRKGQYITLREVIDEVGVDAARFFFLMRRTSSHLNFDLEVAKKQTAENPVYYIQYAHARISSILRQQPLKGGQDLSVLKEPEEMEVLKKLWQFPFILKVCAQTLDPYMVTVYLQETAEAFHKFYDRHRVLGIDERTSAARLALINGVKTVLANGLGLLGVTSPEKM